MFLLHAACTFMVNKIVFPDHVVIFLFISADKRRDGRGGTAGGRHAPEEGGDGAAVRRIHRAAR